MQKKSCGKAGIFPKTIYYLCKDNNLKLSGLQHQLSEKASSTNPFKRFMIPTIEDAYNTFIEE